MKDTTTTVQSKSWPDLVSTLVPKYGDPSWYFSFLLLAIVGTLGLLKFIDVKFGSGRRENRTRQEPPTEVFPTRKAPVAATAPVTLPTPLCCDEHTRRLKALEDELGKVYDTFNDRLTQQERSIRETVTTGLATAREEQDRRNRELREDLKEDMDRLETRVGNTVADKLSAFQTGLLSQIQTMFREGQDGIRILGQVPPTPRP